jgi:hypothetical protein
MAAAVMTLMGGFYWAIRGTGGYGGETGGMLAGFGWALLWYGFSRTGNGAGRRPYGGPWMMVAVTLGIALGGMTGYGVYISWVKGTYCFNYPDLCRPVSVWTGYGMLFLCGLHWGGNVGCFMAWCAPQRPLRARDWALRIGCGVAGAVGAAVFVRAFPNLFLPFYGEGVYQVAEYKTCVRALDSIHTIAPHVGLFLGFLAYEVMRGDWRAVAMILTMAFGFAIPFSVGGYWQTFNGSTLDISWWKNWEMTIGLGGGMAFGLAFWWFNRSGEAVRSALGTKSKGLFQSGIPLWLPTVMVLKGLYEGRCEMAETEPAPLGYVVLLVFAAVFVVALALRQRAAGEAGASPDGYTVSLGSLLACQVLIIIAGWAVTIPHVWHLANTVLAVLYVVYLGVSAALLWRMYRSLCASAG